MADVLQSTGASLTQGDSTTAPAKPKKTKPVLNWDGRVGNISLKEYRERKWSIDACYSRVQRVGPAYSLRPNVTFGRAKSNPVFCRGDPHKCMDMTKPHGPSFSCGQATIADSLIRSPGPAAYMLKTTMDPNGHPTIRKNRGARFGTELLAATDEAGPGPGEYDDVKAFKRSAACKEMPAFTTQGREAWREKPVAPGPGVGDYPGLEHCTRVGKHTPITYTVQGKTEPIEPARGAERISQQPGPAHYAVPGAGVAGDKDAAKNQHCSKTRPPEWKQGRESRGLV